jgi:hypothetical protein
MTSRGLTGEAAERNRQRAREWLQQNPERAAETKRRYRERDPEAYAEMRRATNQRYVDANRELVRARQIERRVKLRAEVIDAYGGRCACPGCHVVHAELLTVDHVNGGASHRQNRRSTRDVYAQIVREGFPPEYQLLCGSCNLAKHDRPACPLAGQPH